MPTKQRVIRVTLAAAALGLASLPAAAITDTAFTYTTPKTGAYTIHPMAMYTDGSASASNYFVSWNGASLSVGASGCFMTAVNLPTGATITGLRMWTTDTTGSGIFFNFTTVALGAGTTTSIAVQSVNADTTGVRKGILVPIANEVVKAQNGYGLGVCLSPGETFNGARVDYTYTSAGD